MDFRQLLPHEASVELADLLSKAFADRQAPDERPYTVVNFVASVDGRATIGGTSGPLGDDGDRAMFHGLREQVDAVLAGTGTVRVERYGRILGKPARRERRVARGLAPEPLACLITRSGELPSDLPLLDEPESRVVIFSGVESDFADRAAEITVVYLDPSELTLTTALRELRREYDVKLLLCEGGPTLFGALLQEGLVDELFLTLAPKLTGGGRGPTISSGPELANPPRLRLVWLLERDESLYLRYTL
jgi:5-amino-6-(5-phosphoribosylamino)uracil reductase